MILLILIIIISIIIIIPPDQVQPPCYCPWLCSVCGQLSERCSPKTPPLWLPVPLCYYLFRFSSMWSKSLSSLSILQLILLYLHQVVCFQINCSSGFVQHQHLRFPQQRPDKREISSPYWDIIIIDCCLAKQMSCLCPTLRLVPPSETMCWSPSGNAATKVRKWACSRALQT